jgi:hypothetical protein
MRKVHLQGPCRGGLYPLPQQLPSPTQKLILSVIKLSSDRWHCWLGHPTREIVLRVIGDNNLSCSVKAPTTSVPAFVARHINYPTLHRAVVLLHPWILFSDVWGPTLDSFGSKQYYVTLIDDFSKFTWIYHLPHRSEVFKYFQEFQCLVERMFNRKIIVVQSNWGGKYECLNSFFALLVFPI